MSEKEGVKIPESADKPAAIKNNERSGHMKDLDEYVPTLTASKRGKIMI